MSRFNLSAWAVRHQALVLFLIIAISLAGARSYFDLGRAEDPSYTIKTMVIQAFWPGATAEEMQSQVADRIEKRLQELPYFDYVKTYSRPGVTVLQPQLKDSVPGRQVPDIWYQVRKKSTDIKQDLPEGVIGPVFNDEYGDVFSAVYMLSGDGLGLAELKDYAETVRQRLLQVHDVSKVDIVGTVDQRIYLEYSSRKLSTLGIPPQAIIDSIHKQNAVVPAGFAETANDRVPVRVSGAFDAVEAVAAVPVEANGFTFRLGDIVDVKRDYQDPPSFLVRHQGKPAVGVAVAMAEGGNVLDLGTNLGTAIRELRGRIPTGVDIEQIADQPKVVAESVGEFLRSFLEALIIVLAVSFISLGWRTGIVVALAVPLVLAIVFIVMDIAGMKLDRITLGALIIALGLLVDDAIISVEMMLVPGGGGLRLDLDRLSDADRDGGHRGGVPAGGICQVISGRVRRRHLLGGRPLARGVLARRGDLHPLPWREAPARFHACGPPRAAHLARLSVAASGRDLVGRAPQDCACGHGRGVRACRFRLYLHSAAVFPDLVASRAVHRDPPAGGQHNPGNRSRGTAS